jgi:uncharacterized circularly permuted ATP-grasp superfamily protein
MIRCYLTEEPILNNVPTWQLRKPDELSHCLEHLHELVVKEVHGAGGYGMLVGPAATAAEREAFRARIWRSPTNYIAQPTLSLSTCPRLPTRGWLRDTSTAALCPVRQSSESGAGGADAGCAARGIAGG